MKPRIYTIPFANVYPLYVAKAVRKGRTKEEVDRIIQWLTGYASDELQQAIAHQDDFETFFSKARLNPLRKQIRGIVCGVRVEEIKEPLMQEIRYMDKLIDELARGEEMDRILHRKKDA